MSKMRVLEIEEPGENGRLALQQRDIPQPGPGEVSIRVSHAGVNRADLFQVKGRYPAPTDTNMVPGMEVSGHILAVGEGVADYHEGDPVCALLKGGGYAEVAIAPVGQVLPVPEGLSLQDAAALPEALATVWLALVKLGGLQAGENVLIQGGASGIGTAAIQLARLRGAQVFATGRTPEKRAICEQLGAVALETNAGTLAGAIKEKTNGHGVDVILDLVGGEYAAAHIEAAAERGRIVTIALMGGAATELSLGKFLMKNLQWKAMTLRSRTVAEKTAILQELHGEFWPFIAAGIYRPLIDRVFRLEEGEKAHKRMEDRLHIGKILLEVNP